MFAEVCVGLCLALVLCCVVYFIRVFTKKASKVPKHTFFLIDKDLDRTTSVLSQLAFSGGGAFSKSIEFCKLIDSVPEDEVINLVLQTNGGDSIHCERMLRKLKARELGYIAYIKYPCYSAGSVLALGANEIVFYKDSSLGKIDPQHGNEQMMIYYNMPEKYISSKNYYHYQQAKNQYNYEMELLDLLFVNPELRQTVIDTMLLSDLPHFKAFSFEECRRIGLPVRMATQDEIIFFEQPRSISNYVAN